MTTSTLGPSMTSKLRAALDYLGDKLVTHRASRFRPANRSVLDEWVATRRGSVTRRTIAAPYEHQLAQSEVVVERIGGPRPVELAVVVRRKRCS